MICAPCERQLKKPGRHRAHKRCRIEVRGWSAAGPCWCPSCHPITARLLAAIEAIDWGWSR